jgi:hypothetical protein
LATLLASEGRYAAVVRQIAVLTLFAFACTTVRVAALPPGEAADAPGTVAPPIVELWVESSEAVSQAQTDRAAEDARSALGQALSRVQISSSAMGASDAVLFVRERGVALTQAREHQQTWAKVGIVAGVAALIIAVVVANHTGVGPRHLARAGRPNTFGGTPVRPIVRSFGPGAAGPRYFPRSSPIFVDWSLVIPLQPMVYRPDADDAQPFPPDAPVPMIEAPPPPPTMDSSPGLAAEDAAPPPDSPAGDEAEAAPLELPPLSPPADFSVSDRGFFDGNHLALQLDLFDRATGELLWSKSLASGGNPCDQGDVRNLVASALAGQPWARPELHGSW